MYRNKFETTLLVTDIVMPMASAQKQNIPVPIACYISRENTNFCESFGTLNPPISYMECVLYLAVTKKNRGSHFSIYTKSKLSPSPPPEGQKKRAPVAPEMPQTAV